MARTAYIKWLTDADYLRVRIAYSDRGTALEGWMIQYQTIVDGKDRPVVRYDSGHGYPHRDLLDYDDPRIVIDKWWLAGWSQDEALNYAIRDLTSNYETYRASFLQRAKEAADGDGTA